MKTTKHTLLLLGIFTFMILSGCSSKKTTVHYKRQWMLVSFKEYTKEFLIEKKAALNLSSIEGESNTEAGTAYMGCNNMRLTATFSGNDKVTFSNLISTKMFCPGNLENDFTTAIAKTNRYKIEGHFLYLYDEKEQQMKFVAADWD
ncbi:META domain-containing protein [Flavobacterium amniphilum]|uniref:META domain-containing protein n=1 Tax=Flavobacterium amniphilum TaxID=1834035 RepID=UPI002029C5E9|nr:META domain-containing protein [Flavobacterium amniphilum]MCL9805677.1 META domain-containing protein [Flavobacterium amniphilum]